MVKLYQHQLNIINDDKKKCGLFLGTGSGKSLTSLMLAQGKVLVICPKTIKEAGTWNKALEVSEREDISVTIISKETFRRDHEILERCDTLIIDEIHSVAGLTPDIRYKNKQPIPKASQLFEATQAYIKRVRPERIYALTATPTRNPMCVLGIAWILGENWDFYKFRDVYYTQVNIGSRKIWVVRKSHEVKERQGKAVRNLGYTGKLSDYFDFPEQVYITKEVGLTSEQIKKLRELPLEYPDPIVLCGKRNQVENGILNGDKFNDTEYFDNRKLEVLVDYAMEFPKMIVFSKYIHQIEKIAGAIKKETGKKVFIITGDVKERGDIIEEAEKTEECVLIVSSQISAGWEAPSFPVMIFASMSFSLIDRVQGEGRILRANNLKKNLYITLVARDKEDTVDEAVFEAIENKKDFSEAIYSKRD